MERYNNHHPNAQIKFHAHDLRALFATMAAQEWGVDSVVLMKVLGHTNYQITSQYYIKPQQDMLINCFDQIEKKLKMQQN